MNLAELQNLNLDVNNIGSWPLPIRAGAVVLICVAVLVAGYFVDTKSQLANLESVQAKETELKGLYESKQARAANLQLYREQMLEMERSFGALLRQLPGKTEVAELLSEVSTAGVTNGLQFNLFKPQSESPLEFYAELPIELEVAGGYHEFGRFVSDVSELPRIVTLHNFSISAGKQGEGLIMKAQAKTYRYLDDEELAAAAKSKSATKKAGRR